jgi:hypothetical protein
MGLLVVAGLASAGIAGAQPSLLPGNAQSVLYFPHLNEGGPDKDTFWQAEFVFVNTNSVPANLTVSFYNDDGSPMMIDFGAGPVPSFTATVPSQGSHMFRSQFTHKSAAGVWGWAGGQSDIPVFAQLNYRYMQNGQASADLATNATTGTALWTAAATPNMGIAVANPSPDQVMMYTVNVRDSQGADAASKSFQIPPHGHDAFTLSTRIPLPQGFQGSVRITGNTVNSSVFKPAVWTVGSESGVFATMPDGRSVAPQDQWSRVWRVWGRVMATAHQLGYQINPQLHLPAGTAANGIANAQGGLDVNGNEQVTMYMSLVKITGDSDGELAFLMAHQLAHVIQCRTSGCKVAVDSHMAGNYEWDADEMGMMISTSAGYDSYSAAGAFAKLQMGNGQVGMGMMQNGAVVWEDMMSTDPHGLFAGRITNLYQVQVRMCTNPQFQAGCQAYKNIMHPSTGGMASPM